MNTRQGSWTQEGQEADAVEGVKLVDGSVWVQVSGLEGALSVCRARFVFYWLTGKLLLFLPSL